MDRFNSPPLTNPFEAFFVLPVMMGGAMLCYSNDLFRYWWHNFFRGSEQHKEGHAQLAVPEPLERDYEHDLFA